jgi:hypothetical protein
MLKLQALQAILLAADSTAAACYSTNKAIRREFTIETYNRVDGTKGFQTTNQQCISK